jgi:hypothetical protein
MQRSAWPGCPLDGKCCIANVFVWHRSNRGCTLVRRKVRRRDKKHRDHRASCMPTSDCSSVAFTMADNTRTFIAAGTAAAGLVRWVFGNDFGIDIYAAHRLHVLILGPRCARLAGQRLRAVHTAQVGPLRLRSVPRDTMLFCIEPQCQAMNGERPLPGLWLSLPASASELPLTTRRRKPSLAT